MVILDNPAYGGHDYFDTIFIFGGGGMIGEIR